ncbi:hypothetical protein [Bacillus sp. FJAT-49736]|uniref:hypothetical protein n=1 Tax=Bacillus sp. FJAT-49736 TaxID=2833582 RepID=UPI001BCA02B1|nr:hypothetical protein [Bacillus sp. FJAT-49736]MBS4172722.1 hypothetical protein [Bacillus sp. FJAT-49736]
MKRYSWILVWVLILGFVSILVMKLYNEHNPEEPKVTIKAHITKLTSNEYSAFKTYDIKNPNRIDFRKFTLIVDMKHSHKIISRKINVPSNTELEKIIEANNGARVLKMTNGWQDNKEENFANYNYKIFLYCKGFNEEEIKKSFHSAYINVSWVTKDGKSTVKKYALSDLITFD